MVLRELIKSKLVKIVTLKLALLQDFRSLIMYLSTLFKIYTIQDPTRIVEDPDVIIAEIINGESRDQTVIQSRS